MKSIIRWASAGSNPSKLATTAFPPINKSHMSCESLNDVGLAMDTSRPLLEVVDLIGTILDGATLRSERTCW